MTCGVQPASTAMTGTGRNPCLWAFKVALTSVEGNGACFTTDRSFAEVALASIQLACSVQGDGSDTSLPSCLAMYASVQSIWTCQPVSQLGCCWVRFTGMRRSRGCRTQCCFSLAGPSMYHQTHNWSIDACIMYMAMNLNGFSIFSIYYFYFWFLY